MRTTWQSTRREVKLTDVLSADSRSSDSVGCPASPSPFLNEHEPGPRGAARVRGDRVASAAQGDLRGAEHQAAVSGQRDPEGGVERLRGRRVEPGHDVGQHGRPAALRHREGAQVEVQYGDARGGVVDLGGVDLAVVERDVELADLEVRTPRDEIDPAAVLD